MHITTGPFNVTVQCHVRTYSRSDQVEEKYTRSRLEHSAKEKKFERSKHSDALPSIINTF